MNSKTQIQQVQEHLEAGYPITPAKAMAEYNVWRLAALIHKLRQRGLNIVTYDRQALNGKRYAEYVLEPARETVVRDDQSVFGLQQGVTTGRSTMTDDMETTQPFKEGDVVKVVDHRRPHHFMVPSIAVVASASERTIKCYGLYKDKALPHQGHQFLMPEELEKVTDYTGLKIKVKKTPGCTVCGMVAGATGVIDRVREHPSKGFQYGMRDDEPRPVVCQNSSDIVPQALPTDTTEQATESSAQLAEGTAVRIKGKDPDHYIPAGYIGRVLRDSGGALVTVYGYTQDDKKVRSQIIDREDLEPIYDWTGLTVEVVPNNSCPICKSHIGKTGRCQGVSTDVPEITKVEGLGISGICTENLRVVPTTP